MKLSTRSLAGALGAILVAILPRAAAGDVLYHVTNLGERFAVGLNNSGQVVGNQYAGEDIAQQPFLYSAYGPNAGQVSVIPGLVAAGALGPGGQVAGPTASTSGPQTASIVDGSRTTVLAPPPDGYLQINGLNASGQGAGLVQKSNSSQAALVEGSKTTALPGLGGSYSNGNAVNDAGQVAGSSSLPGDAASHAFLYSSGRTVDLGTLGGPTSVAFGMNAAGDVVGQSEIAPDGSHLVHAFLSHDGRMTDLGTLSDGPGAQGYSEALAINSSGVAVGDSNGKATVFVGGKAIDLNSLLIESPGSTLQYAIGINDLGQILAEQFSTFGVGISFLLTPEGLDLPTAPPPTPEHPLTIPEPGAMAAFGILTSLILCRHRPRTSKMGHA